MTQINPFTGAIILSGQVQLRQSAEKERQIRRLQNLSKNAALQGDRLEHQVESSDTLHVASNEQEREQPRRQPQQQQEPQEEGEEGTPHIDLTA